MAYELCKDVFINDMMMKPFILVLKSPIGNPKKKNHRFL